MVKIRLRRTGKKKQPSYRLVVTDSRSPRDGRFIEIIGHYIPIRQPKVLNVKADRARYWLSVGARPSDTVERLLKQVNILDSEGRITAASEDELENASVQLAATHTALSSNGRVSAAVEESLDTTPAAGEHEDEDTHPEESLDTPEDDGADEDAGKRDGDGEKTL